MSTPNPLIEQAYATPYGFLEVTVQSLRQFTDQARLVDVRELDEIRGEMPILPGVEHVPLAGIRQQASQWSPDEPIVLICRSGARSGHAALALQQMGFTQVTSLAGGMIEWTRTAR